jgi:hypothetical protein
MLQVRSPRRTIEMTMMRVGGFVMRLRAVTAGSTDVSL